MFGTLCSLYTHFAVAVAIDAHFKCTWKVSPIFSWCFFSFFYHAFCASSDNDDDCDDFSACGCYYYFYFFFIIASVSSWFNGIGVVLIAYIPFLNYIAVNYGLIQDYTSKNMNTSVHALIRHLRQLMYIHYYIHPFHLFVFCWLCASLISYYFCFMVV